MDHYWSKYQIVSVTVTNLEESVNCSWQTFQAQLIPGLSPVPWKWTGGPDCQCSVCTSQWDWAIQHCLLPVTARQARAGPIFQLNSGLTRNNFLGFVVLNSINMHRIKSKSTLDWMFNNILTYKTLWTSVIRIK